jgi:S1-C subfamily serine protease
VKRSLAQLEKHGKVEYAYLGVSSQALYPQLAQKLGLHTRFGGLLAQVVPGGPADEAGLQGGDREIHFQAAEYKVGGDVILAMNGRKVVQPDDLARFTSSFQPGRTVTLTILHDGERKDVKVTLGKRPEGGSSG